MHLMETDNIFYLWIKYKEKKTWFNVEMTKVAVSKSLVCIKESSSAAFDKVSFCCFFLPSNEKSSQWRTKEWTEVHRGFNRTFSNRTVLNLSLIFFFHAQLNWIHWSLSSDKSNKKKTPQMRKWTRETLTEVFSWNICDTFLTILVIGEVIWSQLWNKKLLDLQVGTYLGLW